MFKMLTLAPANVGIIQISEQISIGISKSFETGKEDASTLNIFSMLCMRSM